MGTTVVAIPVREDGRVGERWGKAPTVAVATVCDGDVTAWEVHDVRWDVAHDAGTEGSHHARVARFLREQGVEVVVAGHMGPPMQHMLGKLGIRVVFDAAGAARAAAVRAVTG